MLYTPFLTKGGGERWITPDDDWLTMLGTMKIAELQALT